MEDQKKLKKEEAILREVLSDELMVDVSGGQSADSGENMVVCAKCGYSFPDSETRDGLCHDCWFRSPQHGFGIPSIQKPR